MLRKVKKKKSIKTLKSLKLKSNKIDLNNIQKKIQRGNAAQLTDDTQTSFLSIFQSENFKTKLKELNEKSC